MSLFAFLTIIFIYYSIVKMAKNKGRSVIAWIILSLIITPIFAVIILAILGDSRDKQHKELMDKLDRMNRNQQ